MCEHSLEQARRLGFSAMQFNIVVSTNEAAIALWKRHGFEHRGNTSEGLPSCNARAGRRVCHASLFVSGPGLLKKPARRRCRMATRHVSVASSFLLEVSLVSGSEHCFERGAFARHLCHEFLDEDTLAIFEARRAC